MSMTLAEWDADAKRMTDAELATRQTALNELALWPAFNLHFGWTGFHALVHTLELEILRRRTGRSSAPVRQTGGQTQ